MEKRIGWSATTLSISAGIVLAIFEVMGWKMPILVANILITITTLAGFIAVIVLSHAVRIWSRPIRERYGLRSPIYRRDKPNPLQWLIDRAEKQRHNPIPYLVVRDRIYFEFKKDATSSYIWVRIFYNNLGIHGLRVGRPEGFVYYNGEKLLDKIPLEGGYNGVAANGGNGEVDFRIYIRPEFVPKLSDEIASNNGEVRRLDLHDVSCKIYVENDDTHCGRWNLGGDREIFRPNR